MDYIQIDWLQTVNSALLMIGAKELTSLDEGSSESKQANILLPEAVYAVMSVIPFNGATVVTELNKVTNIPGHKFKYTYALPKNLVRINECITEHNAEWHMLNKHIISDSDTITLKYIELPKDLKDVPIVCWHLISLKLASLLAVSLARNESTANNLETRYSNELSRIISFQGKQDSQSQSEWTNNATWIRR